MSDKPIVALGAQEIEIAAPMFAADYSLVRAWDDEDDLSGARAIIVLGNKPMERRVFDACPHLGLIACISTGYEGVDLALCRERGIKVSYGRGATTKDVADFALGLMIGSRRRIVSQDRALRASGWPAALGVSRSLGGARLGIVGLGDIGAAVAARGDFLGMEVKWWGPREKPHAQWERAPSLIELARWAEILAVCASASAENLRMIGAAVIDALGADGLLVNVARGQLVDEAALVEALRAGRLGSAALDVFDPEPAHLDLWADAPNTILTPHIAGATRETVRRMAELTKTNLRLFFSGEKLSTPVSDEFA